MYKDKNKNIFIQNIKDGKIVIKTDKGYVNALERTESIKIRVDDKWVSISELI